MMRNAAFSSSEARCIPALQLYDEGEVVRWAIETGGPWDAGCTFATRTTSRATLLSSVKALMATRAHPQIMSWFTA